MKSSASTSSIRPVAGLTLGILAVSTASIFIRFAQAAAPSLVIAAYRLTLASLLLLPVAWIRHRAELRSLRGQDLVLALLSGIFLAFHFATWITSLQYTTVASSVVLVTTTPLWVALISPFTLKEPLARLVRYGMGLALAGSIVVGLSDTCAWSAAGLACSSITSLLRGGAFLGDFLALVGAIMAAAYILIGRRLRAGISLIPYITIVYGMAAATLLVLTLTASEPLLGYPPVTYLWFLLLAVIPQLLGHSTFNWALRYVSAAYVSITLLGEPIGSTILAYFILKETPTALKIFGAILILVGIYLASRSAEK